MEERRAETNRVMSEERKLLETRLRAAILRGDEYAWRSLVERHHEELRRRAHRLVEVGGDDLVQEAWMVALKRIRSFDPQRGSLAAWLQGVLRGLAANQGRKTREGSFPRDEHSEAPRSAATTNLLVGEVLAELDADERRLLDGKYRLGLSVAELAQRDGRSLKAVESQLSRARTNFKERWRQREGE
jgi:RNA polymerase sigma-70 factor, ECF subfamily